MGTLLKKLKKLERPELNLLKQRPLRAVRDFLRGFLGATNLASDPRAVRAALAARAEKRRSCC